MRLGTGLAGEPDPRFSSQAALAWRYSMQGCSSGPPRTLMDEPMRAPNTIIDSARSGLD